MKYWEGKVNKLFDAETVRTVLSLDEKVRSDYQTVKNEVLTRYNYTPEGNRQRFVNYNPTVKQTFMEYVANLQRLFKTSIQSKKIEQTYDKLSDLLIMSRVLDTIDPRLYSYLTELKPTTLEVLIKLGNNFCGTYGITKVINTIIQTVLALLSQSVIQNAKQNN